MKTKIRPRFGRILLSLFFVLSTVAVMAQKTVTGSVSDESGQPLIGVNVIVKDAATIGTMTGNDGKYSLEVPNENSVLVFSYIGYITKEVKVESQTVMK